MYSRVVYPNTCASDFLQPNPLHVRANQRSNPDQLQSQIPIQSIAGRRMPPREHHQPQEEDDDDTAGVVKLISAEGFEFVVDKKAAMVSNTLRNMLTSPGRVPFITSSVPLARRPRSASQRITSIPLVIHRRLLRDAPGRGPLPGDPHPHPREDLPVFLLVASLLQVPMLTFRFRQSSSLFPFQAFSSPIRQ